MYLLIVHLLVQLYSNVVQYGKAPTIKETFLGAILISPCNMCKRLFHRPNVCLIITCFGVRVIVHFLSFVLCFCIRRQQERTRCKTSIPKKNSTVKVLNMWLSWVLPGLRATTLINTPFIENKSFVHLIISVSA